MLILPKGVWKMKQSFLQFPKTCISKAKTREENRNLKNQGFDCWCRWKHSAKMILLIVQGRYLVQFFRAFVFVHTKKKLTMKNFIKLFHKVEMQKSGNEKKLATVVFYLLCWTKNSIERWSDENALWTETIAKTAQHPNFPSLVQNVTHNKKIEESWMIKFLQVIL